MEKVFVIMVTYNGQQFLQESIQSLLDSDLEISIVVVDNHSTDGTVSYIKENFIEKIHLIELPENLGFGKGNNIGLKFISKEEFDYVFLINQDAIIYRNTIRKLVAAAKEFPEFWVVSPVHLNGTGEKLESYFQDFMARSGVDFYSDLILKKKKEDIYEVPFVNAAAWLLPKKVIMNIGGFDPIFEHYGEDDNFCQRVRYHGGKIGVIPDSFIRHFSSLRKYPEHYLFSDSFYKDYKRTLQITYGDINKELLGKSISQEKRKVFVRVFENFLNLRFYPIKVYFRLYRVINDTFKEIRQSREINKIRKPNYLDFGE